MKLDEIEKIIHIFEKAKITSLEVEDEGVKVKLTKEMNDVNVNYSIKEDDINEEEKPPTKGDYIYSPLVGTFHSSSFSDGRPFVTIGSKVKQGDKLCMIEAMKVMNEITSNRDGTILEILANDGDMIEFDQPLFVIGE